MQKPIRRFLPAFAAICIRGSGAVASFVVTLVIARTFGAAETGYYALAISTINTASFIALTGLDQLTVRTISGDLKEGRLDLAWASLRQAARWVAATGLAIAAFALIASPLMPRIGLPSSFAGPIAMTLLVFPLLRVLYGALRASGRLVASQIFDGPSYTGAVAVLAVTLYLLNAPLNALGYAWAFSTAAWASLLLAWLFLRPKIVAWPRERLPRYANLLGQSWRIFLAAVGQVVTNWLILAQIGAYGAADEVGAYRVAFQIISILALMVSTVENLAGPGFAGDFRVQDVGAAKRRHRRASLAMAGVVGVPSLAGLIFAEQLLAFFGPEFMQASVALRILLAAQLLNVLTGPVGVFLVMSGRERFSMLFSYVGLALSVLVGVILIPPWGATGAAVAYFAAMSIRNIGSYVVMMMVGEKKTA